MLTLAPKINICLLTLQHGMKLNIILTERCSVSACTYTKVDTLCEHIVYCSAHDIPKQYFNSISDGQWSEVGEYKWTESLSPIE